MISKWQQRCRMQEAECEKASMDVKYNMDTKVEDNTRLYKLQKSNFDREINTAVRSLLSCWIC